MTTLSVANIQQLMADQLPNDIIEKLRRAKMYAFVVGEIRCLTDTCNKEKARIIAEETIDAAARMVRPPTLDEAWETVEGLFLDLGLSEDLYSEGFISPLQSEYAARNLFAKDLLTLAYEAEQMAKLYREQRIQAGVKDGSINHDEAYGLYDGLENDHDDFDEDSDDEFDETMIASGELCEHGEYADKCDEDGCPGGTAYKPYWQDPDNVFYYEQREDGSYRFDDAH